MGLVDSHADCPGAGETRGGQASSGERLAIRVVRREKSLISMVRNTLTVNVETEHTTKKHLSSIDYFSH